MELEDNGLEFVVEIEPEPITILVGRYRVDQMTALSDFVTLNATRNS